MENGEELMLLLRESMIDASLGRHLSMNAWYVVNLLVTTLLLEYAIF
jgi:hypothetical protein